MRKRKEEVHEQNGHKFVLKQFYTVVLCAFCRQFLYNAAGMQCAECKFVCHKKCYPSVVTKCISKTNAESVRVLAHQTAEAILTHTQDKDEAILNHRIPHRFEPSTSFTPSWCCHCGMVLPLSRKKARRCTGARCLANATRSDHSDLHRMRLDRAHRLRSPRTRLLRHVHGASRSTTRASQVHQRFQDSTAYTWTITSSH